jgi:hypothetical protein
MKAHRAVRRRGSHIFYTIGSQMVVRLSALHADHPLAPRKIPGTHFCQRPSWPQGHSVAGRVRSIEKSNDLIGIQTHNLPACSTVPQPTTLPKHKLNMYIETTYFKTLNTDKQRFSTIQFLHGALTMKYVHIISWNTAFWILKGQNITY